VPDAKIPAWTSSRTSADRGAKTETAGHEYADERWCGSVMTRVDGEPQPVYVWAQTKIGRPDAFVGIAREDGTPFVELTVAQARSLARAAPVPGRPGGGGRGVDILTEQATARCA
jgi:hypothetical protein